VQAEGWFSYRGRDFRVSKALRGFPVARALLTLAIRCARSSSASNQSPSSTSTITITPTETLFKMCYPCPRTPVTHVSRTNNYHW
jgi:hypothetical protein